jgi:uncharacterized protein
MTAGLIHDHRYLMYWPDRQRTPPEAANLSNVTEAELVTPDGETLVVWRTPAKPNQPTLLYFHGNGEHLAYRAERIRQFQSVGYGVYMLAYRGFSGSTGKPTERANVADALLAYDTLRAEGLPARDIVLYGESLGTGVATQIAVQRPARGLILEAPFLSLVHTWQQFAPYLPISTIFTDRYESFAVIGQVTMPILIFNGDQDRLIWPRQPRALFDLANAPKTHVILPGAGHNNLFGHGALAHLRRFISALP